MHAAMQKCIASRKCINFRLLCNIRKRCELDMMCALKRHVWNKSFVVFTMISCYLCSLVQVPPDMLTMEVTEESNPDVRISQREADARLETVS